MIKKFLNFETGMLPFFVRFFEKKAVPKIVLFLLDSDGDECYI